MPTIMFQNEFGENVEYTKFYNGGGFDFYPSEWSSSNKTAKQLLADWDGKNVDSLLQDFNPSVLADLMDGFRDNFTGNLNLPYIFQDGEDPLGDYDPIAVDNEKTLAVCFVYNEVQGQKVLKDYHIRTFKHPISEIEGCLDDGWVWCDEAISLIEGSKIKTAAPYWFGYEERDLDNYDPNDWDSDRSNCGPFWFFYGDIARNGFKSINQKERNQLLSLLNEDIPDVFKRKIQEAINV